MCFYANSAEKDSLQKLCFYVVKKTNQYDEPTTYQNNGYFIRYERDVTIFPDSMEWKHSLYFPCVEFILSMDSVFAFYRFDRIQQTIEIKN